jgi:hypothetical protein
MKRNARGPRMVVHNVGWSAAVINGSCGRLKRAQASPPVFFGRRVRRSPSPPERGLLLAPRQSEGTERRAAHPYSIHALRRGRPWRRARASRRSIAAFSLRHRAALSVQLLACLSVSWRQSPHRVVAPPNLLGRPSQPPSASSWQAARSGRRAEPRCRPSARGAYPRARGRRIRLHHLDVSR